ncbi:MAG: conserved membrane protein of unknown function [Promethearchaeota archaeon]|nr:MAG: conserved membrane protein of unknown function [Candidatus Lokiarchaeota archaeon]
MFQFNFTDWILQPLAQVAALMVLLLAVIWLAYGLYEGRRRGSFKKREVEDWDFKITRFLQILTYSGFFVGIISIVTGTAGLILNIPPSIAYREVTANSVNIFTSIFLIILGIFTFLKPINDLPIASVAGLLVATGVTILLVLVIPDSVVELIGNFVNPKWILLTIFIIVSVIVGIIVKFYIGGLMALSKLISWPPIAIIVSIFCFIQAFALLLFGISLI